MYFIGELRDPKIAQSIEKILREKNLRAQVITHEDHFAVVAEDEESIPLVDSIYRLSVGLPVRHEIPKEWQAMSRAPLGVISKVIMGICVLVFIFGAMSGKERTFYDPFFISSNLDTLFGEVLRGEFWRLWTPMFLHFGFLHILFNLLWVKDIGSALEDQEGIKAMIGLTLVYGLLTNVAQYLVVGPQFGGMSGVVFAYLGQMWMRAKFDPGVPYSLPKRDIAFMIGWLVLCMTGLIGAIANVAHAVGLASGMIVGILLTLIKAPSKNKINPSMVLVYSLLALAFSALSIWVDWFSRGKVFFFEGFIS